MSLADDFFMLECMYNKKEDEVFRAILRCIDIDEDAPMDWPFVDVKFDWYDFSFELMSVSDGIQLTDEQRYRLFDLGFLNCWLNYVGGSEIHYQLQQRPE